jgi:hypothetical protein
VAWTEDEDGEENDEQNRRRDGALQLEAGRTFEVGEGMRERHDLRIKPRMPHTLHRTIVQRIARAVVSCHNGVADR